LGQPAVRRFGLVQAQNLPDQIAQTVEELALERLLGRLADLRRIAAKGLGHGGAVGLNDELAEYSGVLVLAGEDIQQSRPEIRIFTEPVEDRRVEDLCVQESCRSAV